MTPKNGIKTFDKIYVCGTGTRLSRVLDLLFGPIADASSARSSSKPWTDRTVRQAAAALLHLYLARLFDGYLMHMEHLQMYMAAP